MKHQVTFPRRDTIIAIAIAMIALLVAVPGALAWDGNLVVRKVNLGGPAADAFTFTVAKSPNQYRDVWTPGTKTFSLSGVSSAAGPFTEGTSQKSYTGLWAGYDSGFSAWVTYTVKEAAKAGYRTTIGCSINPDWNAMVGWSIPAGYGNWTFTPGVAGGDPKVDTTVRWYANVAYTTTCTFTNTYRSRVKVIKDFDDPLSDPPPRVDVTVNGGDVDTSTGAETFGDGDATNWIAVDGGSDVALAEQGTAATSLADYTSVLECRTVTDGSYGAWSTVGTGPAGTLGAVEPGKDYECRFTNVRRRGTIVIRKLTVPATLPASTRFAFTGAVGAFSLGNGESAPFTVAADRTYQVTETVPAGFTLTGIVCSDAQQGEGASTTQGATATVNVQAGEAVTCTFTNTQAPPPVTPPSSETLSGGPTGSPGVPVTPSGTPAARRGTARVEGTTGCAARFAIVDVRGRRIDSVTFRLNGRTAKTLAAPNVAGMFRLRVLTKRLPRGPSTVTADVRFQAASGTPSRRLTFQINRCPRRTVPPPFTG